MQLQLLVGRRRGTPSSDGVHTSKGPARAPCDALGYARSATRARLRALGYSLGFGFALRPVLEPFFSESDELARPADPEELPPDEPLALPDPEESLRPET